jgi:hypothetical protein
MIIRTYFDQFERVKRFLNRIENQERNSTEYDDDLWSFFQNCLHLRDWIINDTSINITSSEVKKYVKNNEELRICSDLAIKSKHMECTRTNYDNADITNRSVTIYAPCMNTNEKGTSTCEHTITLKDGRKRVALDVARKAVEAWENFLKDNGLM